MRATEDRLAAIGGEQSARAGATLMSPRGEEDVS
jgi:hypothetical protein